MADEPEIPETIEAAANALVELADVKRWLALTATDQDNFLQQAINDWSGAIESRLGRVIVSATHTDERHHGGKLAIILRHIPVASIAEITVDGTLIDADDYTFDPDSGIIRMASGHRFCGGPGSVLVTYVAGYETIPGDIVQALKQLVALEFYLSGASGRKALAKRGESMAGGSVTYERGPRDQEEIMSRLERRHARR